MTRIGPMTSHGHKIPNVPDNGIEYTGRVARCSGFMGCPVCKSEAKEIQKHYNEGTMR